MSQATRQNVLAREELHGISISLLLSVDCLRRVNYVKIRKSIFPKLISGFNYQLIATIPSTFSIENVLLIDFNELMGKEKIIDFFITSSFPKTALTAIELNCQIEQREDGINQPPIRLIFLHVL